MSRHHDREPHTGSEMGAKRYNAVHQKTYRERKKMTLEYLQLEVRYLEARTKELEGRLAAGTYGVEEQAAVVVLSEENRKLWELLPRHSRRTWMLEYLHRKEA